MKLLLYITCLLVSVASVSQTVITRNLNPDKIAESITILKTADNAGNTVEIHIKDSVTGNKYDFVYSFENGRMISLMPVPDEVMKNRDFYKLVDSVVFTNPVSHTINPSLNWLLDVLISKPSQQKASFFSDVLTYNPYWMESFSLPGNTVITIGGDTLTKVHKKIEPSAVLMKNNSSISDVNRSWVYYSGTSIQKLSSKKYPNNIELLMMNHAVAIKYKNKYSWVFVNDLSVTDGPEKLRWTSIKQVMWSDQLVWILHDNATKTEPSIYVIDYIGGNCFHLNNAYLFGEMNEDKISGFKISNGYLLVSSANSKQYKIKVEEIKNNILSYIKQKQ